MSKLYIILSLLMSSACFGLGVYYQLEEILHRLQQLIENDPYAFHIRHKLDDIVNKLTIFKCDLLISNNSEHEASRIRDIMKYGFPGLDDIRLYEDFVLSYDRRNRVAHWVCEHLRAPCIRPNYTQDEPTVSRKRAHYQPDLRVPSHFRAHSEDYNGTGFDRGHLAAAANHKCKQSHCNETFFLTNIAPQVGKGFNRDAWNNLENYVRDLTLQYGSVYVYTGPLYMAKRTDSGKWFVEYEVIGSNTIAVPTHFFKVITVESKLPGGSPYMEAYVMPNAPIRNDINIRSFLCDIREIESAAGLQFFDGLRRSYFFSTNYSTINDIYTKFQ